MLHETLAGPPGAPRNIGRVPRVQPFYEEAGQRYSRQALIEGLSDEYSRRRALIEELHEARLIE
ncbi:MAG: hypothetical protein ACNA8W_21455 [Bradymonadaceae bacterium]